VVKTFGVCDFFRLAVTDLALVVFGAYDSYPDRLPRNSCKVERITPPDCRVLTKSVIWDVNRVPVLSPAKVREHFSVRE